MAGACNQRWRGPWIKINNDIWSRGLVLLLEMQPLGGDKGKENTCSPKFLSVRTA